MRNCCKCGGFSGIYRAICANWPTFHIQLIEGQQLGSSTKLIDSATRIDAWANRIVANDDDGDEADKSYAAKEEFDVEEAIELMRCTYEDGTQWGKEVIIVRLGDYQSNGLNS